MSMLGTSRGQSPLNFGSGGGLGGVIIPLAGIGLAGWAAYDLLAVSVLLAAATAGYALLIIALLVAMSRGYVLDEGVVKFFLVLSVFIAAATAFLVFRNGFMRLAVGDALVIITLAAALFFGLWRALSWLMRAVTVAAIMLLAAAPFTDEAERNEKWMVNIEVRDQTCARVRYPTIKCQLISDVTGEVLDERGPDQNGEYGMGFYVFDGSPFGKKARCEASHAEHGSGVAIAEPTWIFAGEANIRLSQSGESQPPCTNDD